MLYELQLLDGVRVAYDVEIPVEHPGLLTVHAEWSGLRILSFRLADQGPTARRTGNSPQVLEFVVTPELAAAGEPLSLTIRSLPMRGEGSGTLAIRLPGPPAPDKPAGQPVEVLPAAKVRPLPEGSPESWYRFDRSAARLRERLEDDSVPDACRWQEGMLAWIDDVRDRMIDDSIQPAVVTREALGDVLTSIRRVEKLRTSGDPAIAGPAPEEPRERKRWIRLRERQIIALELELDKVRTALERGHAPELQSEPWATRLVGCVTACERFFEERVRVGDSRALNLELARDQWDRILTASEALESLVSLDGTVAGVSASP